MANNSTTFFGNDSGVAGGPIAYVSDAFQDVTDTPNSNAGWSSTVSNNPLNTVFGNDDFPRFGPKTLWIRDLILLADRALWIQGKPTYQIVWNEPFPSANGYVFGNIELQKNIDQTVVVVKSPGDGFGVTGVFARAMFMMIGNTAAAGSATGTVFLDGSANGITVDFSNYIGIPTNGLNVNMYAPSVHAAANENYNIHDFRLVAVQGGSVFKISGVQVYSENSSLSIDQFPGTTYNNKTQSKSTSNTTLPLPSFGASLGGRSTIWKNTVAGYSMSSIGVSTITSICTGTNATNILNVTTGQGASFAAGYGIVTQSLSGASGYVGIVQSVSTDALTVYPTLPFGISNSIYRYFQAGQSLAMNSTLNILAYTFGATEIYRAKVNGSSFVPPYLDPGQNFAIWGNNFGATYLDVLGGTKNPCLAFASAAGFLQVEGYFSAAEIEWVGMSFGILSGTMIVNGLPAYNHSNIGFTGILKKTVFNEAGPGWNTFAFFPGSSHINTGISRINMYTRNRDISASYGILAAFDTLQAYVPRATNATVIPPGIFKRTYADQLLFKGPWVRAIGATLPGGVAYIGSTTTCTLGFQYYGSHFAVIGGSFGIGGSMTLALDSGGSNLGSTSINTMVIGTSTTFHSVSLAILGGTNIISGIDFVRITGEMKNLQLFSQTNQTPLTVPLPSTGPRAVTIQTFTTGSGTYFTPQGPAPLYIRVRMVGGGGGGGVWPVGAASIGGGAGAYIDVVIFNPAYSYAYTVGTGGGSDADGGNTTFGPNIAGLGQAGNAHSGVGGAATVLLGTGIGVTGDGGMAGSNIGGVSNAAAVGAAGGAGAAGYFGGAPRTNTSSNGNGTSAAANSGSGGGGSNPGGTTGGSGGTGFIVVEEYYQ